jgi:hypothetical protein
MKIIAAACALVALLASPSLAQAPVPPTEAAIDRFLEALPDIEPDRSIDHSELERLAGLNAGRIEDIRRILEAHGACLSASVASVTRRLLRDAAIVLGARNLGRITEFIEGPGRATFDRLSARTTRGEALTDAETRELERLRSAYPIDQFKSAVETEARRVIRDPEFMTAADKCWLDRDAAFVREGVRSK